jgi:Flp pilus assembly protein TadG
MVEKMFATSRTAAPQRVCVPVSAKGPRGPARLRAKGERGAALVEFALVVPMFLILMIGMYSFGLLFTEDISLTEAVNIGGEQFAIQRNQGGDPCSTIAGYVVQASPFLTPSRMAYTFTVNGTATSFAKGVTPTCPSMATTLANETVGVVIPVKLSATYYCTGVTAITIGTLASFNPLPTANCTLTAQITEILQ